MYVDSPSCSKKAIAYLWTTMKLKLKNLPVLFQPWIWHKPLSFERWGDRHPLLCWASFLSLAQTNSFTAFSLAITSAVATLVPSSLCKNYSIPEMRSLWLTFPVIWEHLRQTYPSYPSFVLLWIIQARTNHQAISSWLDKSLVGLR